MVSGDQIEVTYYLNDVSNPLSQVLMTYNDEGVYDTAYTYGNERIGIDILDGTRPDAQNPLYYLYDGEGSVSYITKPDGEIRDTYKYDEFGKPKSGKLSPDGDKILHTSFGYTGEQWDEESQLQYLRARYYDPETGRYLSRDTYEGRLENPLSKHLYIYVENNPIKNSDPSGHAVGIMIYSPFIPGHGAININGTVYSFYPEGGYTSGRLSTDRGWLYKMKLLDNINEDKRVNDRSIDIYYLGLSTSEEYKIKNKYESLIRKGKHIRKYEIPKEQKFKGDVYSVSTPYHITKSNCIELVLRTIASSISRKKYEEHKELFNAISPWGANFWLQSYLTNKNDSFVRFMVSY